MANFLDLPENEKAHYAEIMKAYIDTAKSFTQVSTAALLLPIVFFRQLLALDPGKPMQRDSLLRLTWLSFLVATGFGLLYQYLAVKYLSAPASGVVAVEAVKALAKRAIAPAPRMSFLFKVSRLLAREAQR